ncbi:microtubule associated protein 9 [Phyllostomus discolor]|uniref:Microtubule associated protein 9 n=1 Tax=Phyllostomus discolor TaxID=89673 RepID=A0A833ZM91_9CHIR|nr:microtubule associated protein 9 [Phyllostomus discolor]
MSGEVFSTTLAYTKSPKVTKRTTFQDELIKAITARSARQRSSEYSDDFDSDEIVSLGDFSDTSMDENSVKKTINDFHISDDEQKNSPKLSFLKTKKSSSDMMKDEPSLSIRNDEETAPNGGDHGVVNPISESQNEDQQIEEEKIQVKPKPRILSIKNPSSADTSSSQEAEKPYTPLPRPRTMLKKHSLREEKDGQGEEKETAPHEESEVHAAPLSLPEPNDRQLENEKKAISENLDPEQDPWLTSLSSSSLKESLGDSFSPGSEEKTSIKGDQNEEYTENHQSLTSAENEENSLLIDFVTNALEKSTEGQVTADDLEEKKEKAELIMNDDLTIDLQLSQRNLKSTNATESVQKTIEDRNTKNKKSTSNRASSALGRLMTSEYLKNSVRRTPSKTTSSQYLGTLKILDQKPSQKQNIEPDRADDIRAAVYQEWLEKKNAYIHEKHRIKRIESENLRIQNEQKRAAKREEALASFEAWKAMKEKEAKKIAAKKRLEEINKKKTEEESAARKEEAQQAFERWKEKKMEYLKEKNKKEKEYERAKKQKEAESVAEKRKDNLTAVEKWSEKKEAFFKERRKEKISEKRKEELKRTEKKDKDRQAIDEYEKWLEKKERQERIERRGKKHHSFLENEALPPWNPPSRTVFSKVF